MVIMIWVIWGCEFDDVLMLYVVCYVCVVGGLDWLFDVKNGV